MLPATSTRKELPVLRLIFAGLTIGLAVHALVALAVAAMM